MNLSDNAYGTQQSNLPAGWQIGQNVAQQSNSSPDFLIGVHRMGLAVGPEGVAVLIAEIERLRALLNPAPPTLYHWLGRDAE